MKTYKMEKLVQNDEEFYAINGIPVVEGYFKILSATATKTTDHTSYESDERTYYLYAAHVTEVSDALLTSLEQVRTTVGEIIIENVISARRT